MRERGHSRLSQVLLLLRIARPGCAASDQQPPARPGPDRRRTREATRRLPKAEATRAAAFDSAERSATAGPAHERSHTPKQKPSFFTNDSLIIREIKSGRSHGKWQALT